MGAVEEALQEFAESRLGNGSDSARRLVGGTSSASGTSSSGFEGAGQRNPTHYLVDDCPYTKMGKYSKFDIIDNTCLLVDLFLWIVLNLWAWRYYTRECHRMEKRVQSIHKMQDGKPDAE